jgi:hypothetical protein
MYVLTTGQDVHATALEAYELGQREWAWTVQSSLRLGEPVLIYVAKPLQTFAWIGRGLSDAERPEGHTGHWTAWLELRPLREPLSLEDVRRDAVLGESPLTKRGAFRRTSRHIEPALWDALIDAAARRDPR